MIYSTLVALHWIAAFVLFIEVVNRMEGCKCLEAGVCGLQRAARLVKGLAYVLIGLASCGALISPVLREIDVPTGIWVDPVPSVSECLAYIAFAAMVIVRWVGLLIRDMRAQKIARAARECIARESASLHRQPCRHEVKP